MKKRNMSGQSGFTLIEVMVVVAILGILAAVVVKSGLLERPEQARIAAAKISLKELSSVLELYKLDNYRYPTTDEGLDALVNKPASARVFPQGGYVKGGLPKDPWGNPFQYAVPGSNGRSYDLYSWGADGAEGGEGDNADIYAE